jgi:hypothetical protein
MNLHENIHRIHQMMGVINESKKGETIRHLIDKMGVAGAIKMVGNYYMIEPYLKEIDKVNYIKEKVSQISDELGGNGFGLVEVDSAPILYSEDEDELRQIEYLGRKQLYVDVYSSDSNSNLGDFKVNYESLPGQILDELVEVLVNYRNV